MRKMIYGMAVAAMVTLLGCGSGGGDGGSGTSTPNASVIVTGTVKFPQTSVAKVVEKTALTSAGSSINITITGTDGRIIATPTASLVAGTTNQFTFSTPLDLSKYYIVNASWNGKTLEGLADMTASNDTTPRTLNVDVTSTALVLVVEKKLGFTSGSLGTTTYNGPDVDSAITSVMPDTLLEDLGNGTTPAYTQLVNDITSAIEATTNPISDANVSNSVTTAAATYKPAYHSNSPEFTAAAVIGNAYRYYYTSDGGMAGTGFVSFNGDGTGSYFGIPTTWVITHGTLIITVLASPNYLVEYDLVSGVVGGVTQIRMFRHAPGVNNAGSQLYGKLTLITSLQIYTVIQPTVTDTLNYMALVHYADGLEDYGAAGLVWNTSNASVLYMSPVGGLKAVSVGNAVLSVSIGNISAAQPITVKVHP